MRTHKVVPARNIIDMISVAKVIEFTTLSLCCRYKWQRSCQSNSSFLLSTNDENRTGHQGSRIHVDQTLAKEPVAPSAHAEIVTSGKSEDVSSWRRTRASDWTRGLVRYADLARHYSPIPGATAKKQPASSKSLIRHLSSIRRHFFVTSNRARSCEITITSHTLLSISLFSTLIAGGISIALRILQQ